MLAGSWTICKTITSRWSFNSLSAMGDFPPLSAESTAVPVSPSGRSPVARWLPVVSPGRPQYDSYCMGTLRAIAMSQCQTQADAPHGAQTDGVRPRTALATNPKQAQVLDALPDDLCKIERAAAEALVAQGASRPQAISPTPARSIPRVLLALMCSMSATEPALRYAFGSLGRIRLDVGPGSRLSAGSSHQEVGCLEAYA
jgi:hypothetical protein